MSDQQNTPSDADRRLRQRRSGLERRQGDRRQIDVPVEDERRNGGDRRSTERRTGQDRRSA